MLPEHMYCMTRALGAELQWLLGCFEPEVVAGLVQKVEQLLELLEALVGLPNPEPETQSGGCLNLAGASAVGGMEPAWEGCSLWL